MPAQAKADLSVCLDLSDGRQSHRFAVNTRAPASWQGWGVEQAGGGGMGAILLNIASVHPHSHTHSHTS